MCPTILKSPLLHCSSRLTGIAGITGIASVEDIHPSLLFMSPTIALPRPHHSPHARRVLCASLPYLTLRAICNQVRSSPRRIHCEPVIHPRALCKSHPHRPWRLNVSFLRLFQSLSAVCEVISLLFSAGMRVILLPQPIPDLPRPPSRSRVDF